MTDNHNYETPEKGATEWHESLNRNFRYIDRDVEIRDLDAAKTDYRPKSGAKFLATDTENVYVGDGSQWLRLATSGQNPSFDTMSTKTIVDRNSGNGYTVDQLAGGSGSGGVKPPVDAVVTLEGGTPSAYRADGRQLAQDGDAAVVFQAAFDEVNANGGGTIHVGPGEFPIDQDMTPYSNTEFVGAGMEQTVLKATSNVELGNTSGDLVRLHLRDFTFDGQNQGGRTRVYSGGVSRCKATRVAVLNCGERSGNTTAGGLGWRTGSGDRYNQIIDCYAENCSHVSLSVQKQGEYNEIRGCTVVNPNNSGGFNHPISIESNTNSVMADNTVVGDPTTKQLGNPALNANATQGCVISNNNVRFALKAVNIANGADSTAPRAGAVIDGNNFQECVVGIRIQNSSTARPPEEVIISNNLIRDSINPTNYDTISNGLTERAITLNNSARAQIVGNDIIRCNTTNLSDVGGPITIQNNYFDNTDLDLNSSGGFISPFTDERSSVSNNNFYNSLVDVRVPALINGNVSQGSEQLQINGEGSAVIGNYSDYRLAINANNSVVFSNVVDSLIVENSDNSDVFFNYWENQIGAYPAGNNLQYNIGTYTTENSGSASVADGGTIAHGLDQTPTYVNVTTTAQGHIASASSVGSSNITVELVDNSGSTVGSAETVYWEAKAR